VQGNAALRADGLLHSDIPSLETSTADLFNWVCPRCAPAQTAYGFLPWWTAPNLQISFFRPLSSLTHWIDYTLWPNAIAIMHFENLLCLAALVGIFFFLYKKTIKTDAVALLAIVFIVLNVSFFYIADWIAARNSLLAALFGVGSIGAYHVFQSSQRLPSIFFSVFLFIMGLFSGESSVAAFAYIVSYAFFMDKGKALKRFGYPLLFLIIIILWRIVYKELGYSVSGSGLYIDPGKDMARFISQICMQGPLILVSSFFAPSLTAFSEFSPRMTKAAVSVSLIVCAIIAWWLLGTVKKHAEARWFLGGALVALPISCAGRLMSERMTIFVVLGIVPVIAMAIFDTLYAFFKKKASIKLLPFLAVCISSLLIFLHLVYPVYFRIEKALRRAPSASTQTTGAFSAIDSIEIKRNLIVINATDPGLSYYPYVKSVLGFGYPPSIQFLASSPLPLRIVRNDSATLSILSASSIIPDRFMDSDKGPFKSRIYRSFYFMAVFRAENQPFHESWSRTLPGMRVSILSLNSYGFPKGAKFTFDHCLDSHFYSWIYWNWQRKSYSFFPIPVIGDTAYISGAW
jgi:hypothetical protein